jgi:Insertion element 4 transposase N-terminal
VIPFDLVDGVLADTRAGQRRLRLLPSRVGVYFVLALALFPGKGYRGVRAELTAALDGLGLAVPSPKALRDLRRRLGAAPFRLLFEVLAGPAAWPRIPGVRFGRYRTVSFDGCRTIKVPGTPANRGWLGKMNAAPGETGYPVIALMTLVGTGTRADRSSLRQHGRRGARMGGQAAAPAGRVDARAAGPRVRRGGIPGPGRRGQGSVPGPAERDPPAAGAAPPARRVIPVADRRGGSTDHRR